MKTFASNTALVNTRNLKSTCDARKMTRHEQIGLRKRAFVMYEQLSLHPMKIAKSMCVSGRSLYRWLQAKSQGLSEAITTYLKPKRASKLTRDQVQTMCQTVASSLPTAHGFQTLLWTRKMVADLCMKRWGVKLSESTIGKYFRSVKFSYQKPVRKSYQQDPEKVAHYCNKLIPELFQKVAQESASVYFLDESTVHSDPTHGKTWNHKGQTPVIPQDGRQHRTNVIGALSLTGDSQFLVYEQKTDSDLLVTFLDEFMKTKIKVYLILDNARYHHAKTLHEHIHMHYKNKLTLIYQPPYSPEINPIELVWAHLKTHGINRVLAKNLDELKAAVCLHLKMFMDNKALGLAMFGKKTLDYIKKAQILHSLEVA